MTEHLKAELLSTKHAYLRDIERLKALEEKAQALQWQAIEEKATSSHSADVEDGNNALLTQIHEIGQKIDDLLALNQSLAEEEAEIDAELMTSTKMLQRLLQTRPFQ